MANRLNYNDLLKYMEIVLDMEKNVYVELKSWQDLQGQMNRLGIARNYEQPQKKFVENFFDRFFSGGGNIATALGLLGLFGIPLVAYIISAISKWSINLLAFPFRSFGHFVLSIVIIFGPLIIGLIIETTKENNEANEKYQNDMLKYNQTLADDQARVQKELAQKQYLQTQSDTLATMWRTSKQKLEKMYSYDILEEKYRNIVAVASIYEYLKHERTRSLQRVGSDEGAYNIFESEVRLNKIITNTDIIIQKLDVVIENQRELANTMRNAQNSINNLVTSTNNMSARIQSGMNRLNASVELSNYQQQQTNNELRYMNFMNTLHFYS